MSKPKQVKPLSGHNALSRAWLELVGDELLHVPELQRDKALGWRRWNGKGWECGDDRAYLGISKVAERAWRDKKGRPDAVAAGARSTALGGLSFAAARRRKPLAEWDANPRMLGILDGMAIELPETKSPSEMGGLRSVEREDYVTKVANVRIALGGGKGGRHSMGYSGGPVHQFLLEKLPDSQVRQWVQRWCGYCLSGLVHEQIMVWVWGDTSTGKSTLKAMLEHTLGSYHFSIPNRLLVLDRHGQGSQQGYSMARAPGKRLLTVSEWPEKGVLDEDFFTSITGCDLITARQVRGAPFDLRPQFKLMVFANHLPHGRLAPQVLRRIAVVPMDESHENEPDVHRLGRLTTPESLGEFAEWCFDGWLQYVAHGLRPYPEPMAAIGRRLARTGGEPQPGLANRYRGWRRENPNLDAVKCVTLNEWMLNTKSASSREGRAITRWLRAQFPVKTVNGYPQYILPSIFEGDSGDSP